MKNLLLIVMMMWSCAASAASDQSVHCDVVEYAEMKDMPKQDLLDLFCQAHVFAGFHKKADEMLIKAGAEGGKYEREEAAEANQCSKENDRELRVLKARKIEIICTCDSRQIWELTKSAAAEFCYPN